jgi:hypothetical protein
MPASSVPFFKNLRFRSLLLPSLVLGFVFCVATFRAHERRQSDLTQALERLKLHTELIAEKQREAILHTWQYMTMLLETGEALRLTDDPKCSEVLGRHTTQEVRFTGISIANTDGIMWCSPYSTLKTASISHRAYFQKALTSAEPVMGEAVVGALNNRWLIPFAQSVRDPSGTVRGVLVVTLDLVWLNEEFTKTSGSIPGLRLGLYDSATKAASSFRRRWLQGAP